MKKKAITTQVIFFILMSIFMIWIIIFGFSRISDVEEVLSAEKELKFKQELENAFLFCSEPINEGAKIFISLKDQPFNSICYNCVDKSQIETQYSGLDVMQEFTNEALTLQQGGANFVLVKTSFSNGNKMEEYNIIGDLNLESLGYGETIAWFDLDNSQELEIEIKCK